MRLKHALFAGRAFWAVLFPLLGALTASSAVADCRNPFDRPNEVLDFHLRMKRADWTALLNFTLMPDDCVGMYPQFRAEFRCGTSEPWIKVGVRKKRGTERGVEAPQKPPLKIDFNEDFMGQVPEAKGQRWPSSFGEFGYRKLTLNNGQTNKPPASFGTFLLPVLLKEHVAFRLLRRELPLAPGTAYAKLFIQFDDKPDPEYHGVYILIEDIDRGAIRRRVGGSSDNGRLIKQTKPLCQAEVEFDDGMPNPSLAAFDAWLKKDPAAFAATWLAETEKGVDLDTLLRQEAIREILVNGTDTILNNAFNQLGNNYYAFDAMNGPLRHYVPWDVDQAFGHLYTLCMPNYYKCAPTTPLLSQCVTPPDPKQSVLGQRTVCQRDIQKRYVEIMCQLINGSLSSGEIVKVWDEADRAVRPAIPLEQQPIWGGRDPLNVNTDMSYGAEYVRVRSWIPQRITSVRQQIRAKGVACPDVCPAGATEKCRFFSCDGTRRCANGLWTPCELPAACTQAYLARPDGGVASSDGGGGGPPGAPVDGGARTEAGVALPPGVDGGPPPAPTAGARDARPGTGAPSTDEPPGRGGGDAAAAGCACEIGRPAGGTAPVVLLVGATLLARARRRKAR